MNKWQGIAIAGIWIGVGITISVIAIVSNGALPTTATIQILAICAALATLTTASP